MSCHVILHSDLNCFYASCEVAEDPSLAGKPVAVCGSTEDRHGIVLTATYPAKRLGVKTGMANWQARQVCPSLTIVRPRYDVYLRYSHTVREIYHRYSDTVEPFGMDECWIDVGRLRGGMRDGALLADRIREDIRRETGLTVSIGVSFTKIFAKLGSDMRKPDAVTVIGPDDYRTLVWPLPVSDLLYCGRATTRRLSLMNIHTIGELALADPEVIGRRLGKNGRVLQLFARGEDGSRVLPEDYELPIKSVGHGTTCVTDLEDEGSVWRVLYALAQDVGHRLRKHALAARGVQLTVRDKELDWVQYQAPLPHATRSPLELARAAFALFTARYPWLRSVRALTIRATALESDTAPVQLDLFGSYESEARIRCLDDAVDTLRRRFGTQCIGPASLMGDLRMARDRCETVQMPSPMFR